jgi:hypothetical protein
LRLQIAPATAPAARVEVLRAGLVLRAVQGTQVDGMSYADAMTLIKQVTRALPPTYIADV